MLRKPSTTFVLALAAAAAVHIGATAFARTSQGTPGEGYAWADACKSCHEEIHAAWAKTKHARTLSRLDSGAQQKDCINCHTTGAAGKIEQDGKLLNGSVQCEACHGKAAAHVADPKVKTGLTKKPKREACEACHNAKSPHYRGFYYEGMLGFSHPLAKKS